MVAKLDHLHRNHFCRLIGPTARLNCFAANMTDSESENSFRRHQPETLGADFPCQQFTMLVERKSLRNLYSRPEFVVRSGTDSIRGAEHDMARKRIVPKH